MNMITIRFISFQYKRWMRAIDKIRRASIIEEDRLPYRMAIDYVDALRANIMSGKFNAGYSPYNARYFQWKYFVFRSAGGFWELRGELINAMSVFKSPTRVKGWMGGIPSGERDSGNVSWLGSGDKGRSIPIAQYANWMEFGRRGQPARPLFQPTLVEYSKEGAIRQLGITHVKIRGAWK